MLLERGHAAQEALVEEVGAAPLHRLFDVRAGRMHDLAEMLEDRPGEFRELRDVGVDPGVSGCHDVALSSDRRISAGRPNVRHGSIVRIGDRRTRRRIRRRLDFDYRLAGHGITEIPDVARYLAGAAGHVFAVMRSPPNRTCRARDGRRNDRGPSDSPDASHAPVA